MASEYKIINEEVLAELQLKPPTDPKVRWNIVRDTKLSGFTATVDRKGVVRFEVHKRVGKGGRIIRERLGVWNHLLPAKTARRKAADIIAKLVQGIDIRAVAEQEERAAKAKAAAATTLRQALKHYLNDPANKIKESTRTTGHRATNQMERHAVRRIEDEEGNLLTEEHVGTKLLDTAISDITPSLVREVHLLHSAESPAAANTAMRYASAAVSLYHDENTPEDQELPPNPIAKALAPRRGRGTTKSFWNNIEARKVHIEDAWLPQWWKATEQVRSEVRGAMRLMLFTGLRTGEMQQLEWENVDLIGGTLRVVNTKNGRVLELPLTESIRQQLPARPDEGKGLVFPDVTHPALRHGRSLVEKQLGRAWTNHDLRRSFTTAATNAKVTPYILKALINHSANSRDVTQSHYVTVTTEMKKKALEDTARYIMNLVNLDAVDQEPTVPESDQPEQTTIK